MRGGGEGDSAERCRGGARATHLTATSSCNLRSLRTEGKEITSPNPPVRAYTADRSRSTCNFLYKPTVKMQRAPFSCFCASACGVLVQNGGGTRFA